MHTGRTYVGVDQRRPLSTLFVLAVLVVVLCAAQAVGLCIVFRLGRRAVPGCVPAWSADRAPPRLAAAA
ncbi:hypothetical protein V6U90_29655 [Micromonospora sp. CPCC 206060]|uniref:hypothetical protein n=1 Tax=Micromonospora sp. CPCC 206060 TaxID=3122406 RepID=UPI002FF3E27F